MNSKAKKRKNTRRADMQLIFLIGLAVVLGMWLSRKKAGGTDPTERLDTAKDPFAGESIGSYFLLDELVDNPRGKSVSHKQAEPITPKAEDFIDDEAFFVDEFFK
jgi:hypothetical protein